MKFWTSQRESLGLTVLIVLTGQTFSKPNWPWFRLRTFSQNSTLPHKIYLRSWTAEPKKMTSSKSSETFGPTTVIWSAFITQVLDPRTQSKVYLIFQYYKRRKARNYRIIQAQVQIYNPILQSKLLGFPQNEPGWYFTWTKNVWLRM